MTRYETPAPWRPIAALALLLSVALGLACSRSAGVAPRPITAGNDAVPTFAESTPEAQGVDSQRLLELTEWVRDIDTPIFSILISRNGRLVYELYTSSLGRDEAHYQMSVTKSVVSTLVGIAIDERWIAATDTPVTAVLPRSVFAGDADVRRFQGVTVKDVLGMSALDALLPPHARTAEAIERGQAFRNSPNRLSFALTQPLLSSPGASFQYQDITPALAIGLVQYASGKSALELAEERLFAPMGFRNYEWMHQDPAGFDLGGYGLRLRPIDMQKLGVLFLRRGAWEGRQLVSEAWVERAFAPWIRSRPRMRDPDYGWYWWTHRWAPGWTARTANGWKGQRIAVIPEQGVVVTMTGYIEDEPEDAVFAHIMSKYVVGSVVDGPARPQDPAVAARLAAALEQVRSGRSRLKAGAEARMVPSVQPKERHRPFTRDPAGFVR